MFVAVITARMFVWPPTDDVDTVDAVVIFAGGRGERLERAEKLMDEGVAPVLVIPNGLAPWDTLLTVTSSYQLSRAGWLLSRCFEGEVLATHAEPDLGPLEWAKRIGHEWLGWSRAAIVERGC